MRKPLRTLDLLVACFDLYSAGWRRLVGGLLYLRSLPQLHRTAQVRSGWVEGGFWVGKTRSTTEFAESTESESEPSRGLGLGVLGAVVDVEEFEGLED